MADSVAAKRYGRKASDAARLKTAGVVLAGGRSVRFGSPKAFGLHQGRYFYERAVDALAPVCDAVVIVTREALKERFPDHLSVITDHEDYQGLGPLAGIYSAMCAVQADRYAVLPCDMPFMTSDVTARLLEAAGGQNVCAVRLGERKHPLVSIWSRAMLEPLRKALDGGRYRVLELLEQADAEWLDGSTLVPDAGDAERFFRNVNSPDQMKA